METALFDTKLHYRNLKFDYKPEEAETSNAVVSIGDATNVVSGEKLKKIQIKTLNQLKEFLSMTFGPMGSNTKIIEGNNKDVIKSSYTKDGLKVLQHIVNSDPIEMSIIEEIVEISRHVEHEVGDGTTSTVILSSLIFERLVDIQKKYKVPPFQLIRTFNEVVDTIKKEIIASGTECTLQDIYDISMISTNGNTEVSDNIAKIYEQYGMDVDLSVGISNDTNSVLKVYDGLTITEGMSDPVFINNRSNNTSEIHKAKIYHFVDPIDTMQMISLFEAILNHNIYEPYREEEAPIPTVITCPRISKDMSATLKELANQLYQFDKQSAESAKPPILIITDVVASDEIIMDDIANLCGCKSIRKYIDPNVLARDIEAGKAPTVDNVWEFAGEAELVVSDNKKTKFINPKHMHVYGENGEVEDDPIYTAMINFLEAEIENTKSTDSSNDIGLLKKRLSALKANMVDYLVGGVTISERDATKDLVEDAIKNCNSASKYGVGRAANFEGLYHSYLLTKKIYDEYKLKDIPEINLDIAKSIFASYCDISEILYKTVCSDEEKVEIAVYRSIEHKVPYNISSGFLPEEDDVSGTVKCSIMLDVNILDTISKIVTIMVTSNQCLLQAPQLNRY